MHDDSGGQPGGGWRELELNGEGDCYDGVSVDVWYDGLCELGDEQRLWVRADVHGRPDSPMRARRELRSADGRNAVSSMSDVPWHRRGVCDKRRQQRLLLRVLELAGYLYASTVTVVFEAAPV